MHSQNSQKDMYNTSSRFYNNYELKFENLVFECTSYKKRINISDIFSPRGIIFISFDGILLNNTH